MRDLAKLGFTLLGCYLALAPLAGLARSLAFHDPDDFSRLLPFGVAAAWWVLFGLLPGAFLVWRGSELATLVFPDANAPDDPPFTFRHVSTALLAVAGVWLCIGGFAGLASVGVALAVTSTTMSDQPLLLSSYAGSAVGEVLRASLGLLLALRPAAVVAFLLRESPPAA